MYSFIYVTTTTSVNYNASANTDDGSWPCVYGCVDSIACNYDSLASCDDNSCAFLVKIDFLSVNYDPYAGCDDGSVQLQYLDVQIL